MPKVVERPAPLDCQASGSRQSPETKSREKSAIRTSPRKAGSRSQGLLTPSHVPLPPSRSISPSPPSEASASESSAVSLLTPPAGPSLDGGPIGLPNLVVRIHRSPKRTFDESSGTSSSQNTDMSQGSAKRSRSARRWAEAALIEEADPDADTPSLTASGSSPDSTSSSSAPSPAPTPPPLQEVPKAPPDRPLTRRQRKALGLPKPREKVGKIIIPGGRYKRGVKVVVKNEDDPDESGAGEWVSNGSGRLDVRGFRELKI